jgi:hypothetical protein
VDSAHNSIPARQGELVLDVSMGNQESIHQEKKNGGTESANLV